MPAPVLVPAQPPPHSWHVWTPYCAIGALAFAVYANSLHSGFITDDQFQILNNPVVTGGKNLWSAFGSGVWEFLHYRGNYFRPLQFVIYGLTYRMFGAHAFAFHLLMALLHALNSVLLLALARRLLSAAPATVSYFAASLFAVHPIHTEAVDWIAALPDVLVTTCALTGLLLFATQNAAPTVAQALLHAAIYLAALLTKETGVVLLPLYFAYQRLRGARSNAVMNSAMLAVLATYLALRVHALGGLAPAQHAFFRLTAAQFCMSAAVLFGQYVLALVCPYPLRFFHVFHPTTGLSLALLLSLGLVGLLAWTFLRFGVLSRTACFAGFWVLIALAPAMNIAGVGQNVFAERYLYLPSAGFAIFAALGWQWLGSAQPNLAWPVAAAIVLALSIVTIGRNQDWVDDFTLLKVSLAQSPDSAYLHNLMAGAWVHRDRFDRALEEQRLAVRYEPDSYLYHQNLGNILLGLDPRAAAAEFLTALSIQPLAAELHSDLAIAYRDMGDISKAQSEIERAAELRRASN